MVVGMKRLAAITKSFTQTLDMVLPCLHICKALTLWVAKPVIWYVENLVMNLAGLEPVIFDIVPVEA
jgi:hypothetical protein